MPKIRRRYNYGHVVMNPNIVGGTVLLCGQTVKVRTKNGEGRNIRFAGFVNSYIPEAKMPRVKLYEIEAFSHETGFGGDWVCYGRDVTMLGYYHPDDGVYLALIDGLPVAWCELEQHAELHSSNKDRLGSESCCISLVRNNSKLKSAMPDRISRISYVFQQFIWNFLRYSL